MREGVRGFVSGLSGLLILMIGTAVWAESSAPPLPVAESVKAFRMDEGYRIEAALSEPAVEEPVVAVFDGNGRMFVAEMRTYMQDVLGSDQYAPKSRISLHEDTDGDGVYDKSAVFVDGLVLPRMILPLRRGELLVNVTDSRDIHLYRDVDDDGVADEKFIWYEGGSNGGNLEHQQSGLIWALDNWMYVAIDAWRLRWNGYGKPPLKQSTPPNGGQWGLSQDDYGKPWFVNAGSERGPVNFQTPILYGAFNAPKQLSPDFQVVYPLPTVPDMQAGPRQSRPGDQTLNHFTATCGPDIFRGDRLPESLRGDLFFSEPVGRLVRQADVEVRDGLTYLRNAYDQSEFIRSLDPNSRIVNTVTAPDGTLYLVDMYRGIIQEGDWTGPGTYLYKTVKEHELDKNIGRGRIYRVTHQDFQPGPQPRMYEESSLELVAHLAHPNGWWRDTAQKLLVLRGDDSVVPALERMMRDHAKELGRIHALWTLEGLDRANPTLVREALGDSHPQVRVAAIRVGESLVARGDSSLEPDLREMLSDEDTNVVIQAMLTAKFLKWSDARSVLASLAASHASKGVREIASLAIKPSRSIRVDDFSLADQLLVKQGETIYQQLCFTCHGYDGKGMLVDGARLAPPLARSESVAGHPDRSIAVLLKGLSGPVGGKDYGAPMIGMESNQDEWIASVLSYVRSSFGNRAPAIEESAVKRMRQQLSGREDSFTSEELDDVFPLRLLDRSGWTGIASHRSDYAVRVFGENGRGRWDSQATQSPGMWAGVDFGKPRMLSALSIDTASRFQTQYPLGFVVEAFSTEGEWLPVAEGKGSGPFTEVTFDPVEAQRIRIVLTEASENHFWSIGKFQFFGPN